MILIYSQETCWMVFHSYLTKVLWYRGHTHKSKISRRDIKIKSTNVLPLRQHVSVRAYYQISPDPFVPKWAWRLVNPTQFDARSLVYGSFFPQNYILFVLMWVSYSCYNGLCLFLPHHHLLDHGILNHIMKSCLLLNRHRVFQSDLLYFPQNLSGLVQY